MDFKLNDNAQVLVLAPAEKCINYKWYENAEKIDKRIQLLPPDYVLSADFPCKIDINNGLADGMMLIRHPFIHDYFVDVTKLEDVMLHLKLNTLNSIGLKLGAKEIHIKCVLSNSEKREQGVDAGADLWISKVNISFKSEKERYNSSAYQIDTFNPHTVFNRESYEEARCLAKKYGLDVDANISSLLYDRDPDRPNPFKGRKEVSVSALSETNEKLDIAVAASYLKKFSFNLNVASSCVIRREVLLETKFDFSD